MKEINSLTHSCMHSLASFAILAFSGRAVFIIRATAAGKVQKLAIQSDKECMFHQTKCQGRKGVALIWIESAKETARVMGAGV
jgi:hypothetical protein